MSEPTAANVVPIIPGETVEATGPVKHYRDRKSNSPLCGAEKGDDGYARSWKKVNCLACEAAKREPGRPSSNASEPAEKPTAETVQSAPTDGALATEFNILLTAFVITPTCVRMKKAPPPPEMTAQLGPAVVDVLDHYGYREQMDHPGVKLAVVAAAIGFAVYNSPTIENRDELLKAHGIENT